MRDCWYGDKRDLVKWGSLIHLANAHKMEVILQVALYQPSPTLPNLSYDGQEVPLSQEVFEHFRALGRVKDLAQSAGVRIEIFDPPFSNPRERYFDGVCETLRGLGECKTIAFLDPDTGLAPKKKTFKHVLPEELRRVYRQLKPDDWLVFYQHAPLFRKSGWRDFHRMTFAKSLDLPINEIATFSAAEDRTLSSRQLASDVILSAVRKTS